MIEHRIPAADVAAGDVLVTYNLDWSKARTRVRLVERLMTWVQTRDGRQEFDTVRIHGLGSLDYAPDNIVTVLR